MKQIIGIALVLLLSVSCGRIEETAEKSEEKITKNYDQPKWLQLINTSKGDKFLDKVNVICSKYYLKKRPFEDVSDAKMVCDFKRVAVYKNDSIVELFEFLKKRENVQEEDISNIAVTEICKNNEENVKSFYAKDALARHATHIRKIRRICNDKSEGKLKSLNAELRDWDKKTCRIMNGSWSDTFTYHEKSRLWLSESSLKFEGCYGKNISSLRKLDNFQGDIAYDGWVYETQKQIVGDNKGIGCSIWEYDKGPQQYVIEGARTYIADCEFIVN